MGLVNVKKNSKGRILIKLRNIYISSNNSQMGSSTGVVVGSTKG